MKRLIPFVVGWLTMAMQFAVRAQEVSGTADAGTDAASPALGDFFPLLILIVVFGAIFYFMLIRPQRRRQAKMNELIGGLKRGDRVITAGGIYGEVDSIGDAAAVLILEDGAKIRVAKSSIVQKRDK
jgi:preprotein translocase subunit YajC